MAMVDVVTYCLQAGLRLKSVSLVQRLVVVWCCSAFIVWTGWTLAMTLLNRQPVNHIHHRHLLFSFSIWCHTFKKVAMKSITHTVPAAAACTGCPLAVLLQFIHSCHNCLSVHLCLSCLNVCVSMCLCVGMLIGSEIAGGERSWQ